MHWSERFGIAAAAFGDSVTSAWDLITGNFGDDSTTKRDLLDTLLRVPTGVINSGVQTFMGISDTFSDALHQTVSTPLIAQNLSNSPTWQSQTGGAGFLDGETWKKAWQEAETTSIGNALAFNGTTLASLAGFPTYNAANATDILDKKAVDELRDGVLFNVMTGVQDAAIAWYVDPLSPAAKAVGAARRVSNIYGAGADKTDDWLEKILFRTRLGDRSRMNPDTLAESDGVDEFLHWAQDKTASEIIHHPMLSKSAVPDDLAGIFGTLIGRDGAGDVETARKVIAVGYGSRKARDELMARNDDLAVQISNLENFSNRALLKAMAEKDPKSVYSDSYLKSFEKYEQDLAMGKVRNPPPKRYKVKIEDAKKGVEEKTALQKAIAAAVGEHDEASGVEGFLTMQVPKLGQAKTADRVNAYHANTFSPWSEFVLPKPFAPALKVIQPAWKVAHGFTNKRPPSWIDPNRRDASNALWAYMKTSKAFTDEEMQGGVNLYLEALDITSRAKVIEKIEGQAIVNLANKYGIDKEIAKRVAKEGIGRRNTVINDMRRQHLEGHLYGLTDEDGNVIRIPRFETQQINSLPLLDLEAYDRIFKTHTGAIKAMSWAQNGGNLREPFRQSATDLFDLFLSAWSTINLLRPGYTVRNVTDDTLRSLASLGTMDFVGRLSAGVKNGLGNVPIRARNAKTRLGAGRDVLGIKMGSGKRGDKALEIAHRIDQMGRDLGSLRLQSNDGIIIDGHTYNSQYHGRAASYHKVVSSSNENLKNLTGDLTKELRSAYAQWKTVKPQEVGHLGHWAHAIQNHIGQSQIGKKFLEGLDPESVKTWLKTTGEGRAVLRKLGAAGKNVDAVVGQAQAITDYLVPLMPHLADPFILRKMAHRGEVTEQELQRLFPDIDMRPNVHGPTIQLNLSAGPLHDHITRIVDTGFKWFGSIPTDKLVRHPVFRSLYVGNIRRLHNNAKRNYNLKSWTNADFAKIEHTAREMSLKQINRILYDGSTRSNIAHKLRFITGFFSAWEDSVTKWARIAIDKPETLINAMKLWSAPSEMDLGSTADPYNPNKRVPRFQALKFNEETGEWEHADRDWNLFNINDRNTVLQARLPEWLHKFIPLMTDDQGYVTISKSSLNVSLQGDPWWLPGAGPFTNMAVGQYVLNHPTSLRAVAEWAAPFGGEENILYGLLPAWSRRLWDSGESITNGSRAQTFFNIAQTQELKAKMGQRTRPKNDEDFYKEIEDRTDKFFMLRAFTSFFAPFSVQYSGPFKFYIDQYRALKTQEDAAAVEEEKRLRREEGGHWVPVTADELFLEKYGEDFYGFASSISKNNLGLAASAEVWDKTEKVKQYLNADQPELAALYVGKVADTKFDQYVYDAQFHQELGSGTGKTAREHQSPREAIRQSEIRLGWIKFTRLMDLIDGVQFDEGVDADYIDKLRAKAAEKYAREIPEWGKDYYAFDSQKIPRRVELFQNFLTENPKLVESRGDLRNLQRYIVGRQVFLEELDARYQAGGNKTLRAESNSDLAQKWKNFQVGLAESDTLFSRTFWRYLSNDHLQTGVEDS